MYFAQKQKIKIVKYTQKRYGCGYKCKNILTKQERVDIIKTTKTVRKEPAKAYEDIRGKRNEAEQGDRSSEEAYAPGLQKARLFFLRAFLSV